MRSVTLVTILFVLTAAALALPDPAAAQLEMPRTSPAASVTQRIGVTDVTIEYHRPGVKGRDVWGGLVPYDEVWRAGANERTTIRFSDDVMIEGEPLAAGTYGLLAIPRPESWVIIFSEKADAWGAFGYDEANDALRVEVAPREAPPREWMELRFEDLADDAATAVLHWDRLAVPFRISVDLDARVMENLTSVVRWEYPYQAATYALDQGEHLEDAMGWIEASLALERNFWNLAAKARLLARSGDHSEAVQTGEAALQAAEAMDDPPPEGYRRELREEIASWRAETGS